ncbi:hypothetical protein BDW66DRAFT_130521 [Aspergillus desertorum]
MCRKINHGLDLDRPVYSPRPDLDLADPGTASSDDGNHGVNDQDDEELSLKRQYTAINKAGLGSGRFNSI